jgi:hypothetical protein
VGVGALPFGVCELAESLHRINPQIKIFGSELPQAVPLAYVSLPAEKSDALLAEWQMLPWFQQRFGPMLSEYYQGKSRKPLAIIMVVNQDLYPTEVLAKFNFDKFPVERYFTLAIAPQMELRGQIRRPNDSGQLDPVSGDHTEIYTAVLQQLGGLVGINARVAQIHPAQDGTVVTLHPLQQMLEPFGVELIANSSLAQAGLKDLSLITLCHVMTHLNRSQQHAFITDLGHSLKVGGVLLVKDRTFNQSVQYYLYRKQDVAAGDMAEIAAFSQDSLSRMM